MPIASGEAPVRTSIDLDGLLEALRSAGDRRAAARAGSAAHWEALREIAWIESLVSGATNVLDGTLDGGAPSTSEAAALAGARCRVRGCDYPRMGTPGEPAVSRYCAAHILERTSAPER